MSLLSGYMCWWAVALCYGFECMARVNGTIRIAFNCLLLIRVWFYCSIFNEIVMVCVPISSSIGPQDSTARPTILYAL